MNVKNVTSRLSVWPVGAVALLALAPTADAQVTRYLTGMTPNWDQPHYYPDPLFYDVTGPGAWFPGSAFEAYCAPTSTSMLMGYWEDYHGWVLLADGSPDPCQALPGAYGGPPWGNGPMWHDYCADGLAGTGLPHPLRGTRQVNDLGWYMDTNNAGDPALPNGPHIGTQILDSVIGTINFMASSTVPQPMVVSIFGTHPMFGAFPVQVLADMCKIEIDNERPVVAHFLHWSLVGPPGPGEGTGFETSESQIPYANYTWVTPAPNGMYGEQYNFRDDDEGLGHAVTIVGYTAIGNQVTHLIVHDNWPATVRNVRVSVQGAPLAAVTFVQPTGFTMSTSQLTAGQNGTFTLTGATPNASAGLVYSTSGLGITNLPQYNVTLNIRNPVQAGSIQRANANGTVTWNLPIPNSARGRTVHFQALQIGQVTNVIVRRIQ